MFLLRFLLTLVFFWVLLRLVRAVTQVLKGSPRPSGGKIHRRPQKGRNPIEGGDVIDVEYTEKPKQGGDRNA